MYIYIYIYMHTHTFFCVYLYLHTLQEQSLVNSALITELCLGRWIWKSLKTKTSGAVPWNLQVCIYFYSNMINVYTCIPLLNFVYFYSTLFGALDLDLKIEPSRAVPLNLQLCICICIYNMYVYVDIQIV